MPGARANTFRPRHRLTHDRQFDAVHRRGVRVQRGPLSVTTLPNALEHARLGLSVGVRVGTATVRNRCKRLVREAFRLERSKLAASATGGYDIVVGVRAPRAAGGEKRTDVLPPLTELRSLLKDLVSQADVEWRRRARSAGGGA